LAEAVPVEHRRGLNLSPMSFAIGTANQAFFGLDAPGPALRCARFISGLMAFGAKQLDIFRLLASQGMIVQVVQL
jgi:hypothetical protein